MTSLQTLIDKLFWHERQMSLVVLFAQLELQRANRTDSPSDKLRILGDALRAIATETIPRPDGTG